MSWVRSVLTLWVLDLIILGPSVAKLAVVLLLLAKNADSVNSYKG